MRTRCSAAAVGLWMLGFGLVVAPVDAHAWKAKKHSFRVGMLGLVGGSAIGKPGEKELQGQRVDVPYGGMFGIGGGGGLTVGYNYRGAIGVQLDMLYSMDRATGNFEVGPASGDYTLKQWALHMPLYVRGTIPYRTVRPSIFIGPEFIFPSEPDVSLSGDPVFGTDPPSTADFYTALGFGVGIEFALPVKKADLRIPFSLRGTYNPGLNDNLDDRLKGQFEGGGVRITGFKSEHQFHFAATLGIAYYMH